MELHKINCAIVCYFLGYIWFEIGLDHVSSNGNNFINKKLDKQQTAYLQMSLKLK